MTFLQSAWGWGVGLVPALDLCLTLVEHLSSGSRRVVA